MDSMQIEVETMAGASGIPPTIVPPQEALEKGPSFTLSQSGTFKKEDFVIDRQGLKISNGSSHVPVTLDLTLADLQLLDVLGQGASGMVRLAVHKPSQTVLAVKVINIFDKPKRDQLLRELRVLYSHTCHALVKFYDTFYQEGAMYIALEYMDGGSLADVLQAIQSSGNGSLSELVIAKLTRHMLEGLAYLHNKYQVHRDMKPANVLLNRQGRVKISDFGLAADLDTTMGMCATFVGTAAYMSPERLSGAPYSYQSDIWSLGVILVECALGAYPYPSRSQNNYFVLLNHIINDPVPELPPTGFSEQFRSFVLLCLQKEPEGRPGADQLLEHPYMKMYSDELSPFDLAAFVNHVMSMQKSSH